jgi:hypothetical protein
VRRHAKASFAGSTQGSGMRRGLFGLVCLCVLGLAAFLGISAPSASAAACPNEAFRSGPSASLPDCRAYEMVSPPEKEGFEVIPNGGNLTGPNPLASPDASAVVWGVTRGTFGESASNGAASAFLARRGGSNWSTEGNSPPLGLYPFLVSGQFDGFSEGLDKSFQVGGWQPPLTPDASEGTTNLYVRDNATGTYRLLSVGLGAGLGEVFGLAGEIATSADNSHVVFESVPALTGCGGSSSEKLCDWNAATGSLSLVGVKPGGEVSTGAVSIAGPNYMHPVSADGSRIFFHEGGASTCAGVCARVGGSTTKVVGTSGSTFQGADTGGSVAYITQSGDLKRVDVATEGVTNLTGGGGEVKGVLGTSADGSQVYFVAGKELAPGATAGENNLYLWTAGAGFKFIAKPVTLTSNWASGPQTRSSRVTPDGMHVAFQANNSLTGFPDNGKSQAYLYSAASGALVCASCVVAEPANGAIIGGAGGNSLEPAPLSRSLSDDGRYLFFGTKEALVPQDSNNLEDVYRYDAAGGAVALISPGTAARNTQFNDASSSGNDAFFITREKLVPVDQDDALDVYDARVDGGFASQHPSSSPPCTGEECRGETSTPSLAGAASAGFVGKGNISAKQNCNKLGKEAKKLSKRAKRLRKNAQKVKKAGNASRAKKLNKKSNRLSKQARNKSKSAKKCRKRNKGASK